jgi:single-stranded DNA-binding protein
LVGNIGKEPTFSEFQNPKGSVKGRYRFPLATVKVVKDAAGETVQKVTWHNITTVDPMAEQYIKTGYGQTLIF